MRQETVTDGCTLLNYLARFETACCNFCWNFVKSNLVIDFLV